MMCLELESDEASSLKSAVNRMHYVCRGDCGQLLATVDYHTFLRLSTRWRSLSAGLRVLSTLSTGIGKVELPSLQAQVNLSKEEPSSVRAEDSKASIFLLAHRLGAGIAIMAVLSYNSVHTSNSNEAGRQRNTLRRQGSLPSSISLRV
jgi:hypothetical protein